MRKMHACRLATGNSQFGQRFSIGRRGTSVGDDIVERQQY